MGTVKRMPGAGASLRLVILASIVVTAAGAAAFLYVRLREAVITGFDNQLVAAGATLSSALKGYPVTACLSRAGETDSVMRAMEEWKFLRNVQERAGLTYVYTFIPSGDTGIVYLVDGSPDGQSCAIGQQEVLPKENADGLRKSWGSGAAFVSRVLRYEQWGLLKVSAIPITDSTGASVAMAGADLEVSVIRRQIRSRVFIAAAAALFVIALSWALAWYTERRLLAAVRSTMRALIAVSAGDTRALLPQDRSLPREIAAMNAGVNTWLIATRDTLASHTGRSPEDRAFKARWQSRSPETASCTVLGDYVIAWRRPQAGSQHFYFGPEYGPVSLLQQYFHPGSGASAPAWTHLSGIESFFDSLWWLNTLTGQTGTLGSPAQSWLAIVKDDSAGRADAILTVTIQGAV